MAAEIHLTSKNLVSLTDKAAAKAKALFEKAGKPNAALRVLILSGGCSGMEYKFQPDDGPPKGNDTVSESHGIKIYVENKGVMYMAGSEIDFVQDIMKSGFRVKNPLSQAECACGDSFTV